MNDKILDFFRAKAPVYQSGATDFWNNEHISKGMLAAHLDPENDGASRKLSTVKTSVEWICEQLKDPKQKRLLDLGCGPGIYSEFLYDKGFSVTGIDFSKRSIAYARAHAQETKREIEYCYQNYLDIDYDNEFDAAILIYCDFGVLSPRDRAVLLTKINKALKPGGVLILDVYNKPFLDSYDEMQNVEYYESGFWSPKPHVVIQKNCYYNETDNILDRYMVITNDSCDCYNTWNQIYTKETFMEEIQKQSFETVGIFDDVCGKAFTDQDETMCGVFQKKREE